MNLKDYIKQLEKYYYEGVSYSNSKNEKEIIKQVPKQLEEFYSQYENMKFPYGKIYSIEKAIEMSNRMPFIKDDWFCFGQDYYYSYWLCKRGVNMNDFAFTIWDHEMELNIEEPSFRNLQEVLSFLSGEYDKSELDMCNVIITECNPSGLKDLMRIKKIFLSSLSITDIRTQISKGGCTIKENINLYEANRILLEHKFEHITVLVKKTE